MEGRQHCVRIGQKLFGVATENVFKLYKVPDGVAGNYADEEKIRIKDLEVRIVDPGRLLLVDRDREAGGAKLLALRDGREYKGLWIDAVVKTLSAAMESESSGDCFSGIVRWMHEGNPVTVPVLNVKML
jgi:hypothetical protein